MTPDFTPEELQQSLAPIASLLSKSEKAQSKLAPGTWQHTMLGENVAALRIAQVLLAGEAAEATPDELQEALRAIGSMIERTEKAGAKFAPGTSQHTLQRNRLKALRIARDLVAAASSAPRGA